MGYKLLSKYSIDFLKESFNNRIDTEEYNEIKKFNIYKNIEPNLLNGEEFKQHPYIPIYASNYGRIKYSDRILFQKDLGNGYIYIKVPYEKYKLIKESREGRNKIKPENYLSTPIVEEVVEYKSYKSSANYKWHPYMYIGITSNLEIINVYKDKFINGIKYANENFMKIFNEKINNGINFIEIPIYVYRLVAETWLENPNYKNYKTVHHISNNGYNNTIYNLIWVTDDQHKGTSGNSKLDPKFSMRADPQVS